VRVSVVADEGDSKTGFVGEHLRARGAELTMFFRDELAAGGDPLAAADLLVLLGSERAVHDPAHRAVVAREQGLVASAERRGLPLLAVCYGAQLVAGMLGGRVTPAPVAEIGWQRIESDEPSLVAPGPWFELHYDRFSAPPGVPLVARSEAAPQAFVHGRTLAVQFHPEVDAEIVSEWVHLDRAKLAALGVDVEALLAETAAVEAAASARCAELLERFLDKVATRPVLPTRD